MAGVLSLEYSIIPFVNPINIDLFPFAIPDAEVRTDTRSPLNAC
jgi:hypothetical protein